MKDLETSDSCAVLVIVEDRTELPIKCIQPIPEQFSVWDKEAWLMSMLKKRKL